MKTITLLLSVNEIEVLNSALAMFAEKMAERELDATNQKRADVAFFRKDAAYRIKDMIVHQAIS